MVDTFGLPTILFTHSAANLQWPKLARVISPEDPESQSRHTEKIGFFSTLKRMRQSGWQVEVLAWEGSCNRYMKEWVEDNGTYVPLDDFYSSITFLEPDDKALADQHPRGRIAEPLDITKRPGY